MSLGCGGLESARGRTKDPPLRLISRGEGVRDELKHLGPKDLITGFLVIIVGILVVSFLVMIFKISFYLAIIIGVLLAVVLGIALLGRVIRVVVSKKRSKNL
jgi:uncharacterized protein (DUF983 family)